MKPKIIVIFGPTASGKTALSLQIAEYIKSVYDIGCEVINADSRQVYKGMSVGTSKVSRKIRSAVPHHGLDVELPSREYANERFSADARRLIAGITERGNMPMVVGGTGTYVMDLVGDTHLKHSLPSKDPEFVSLLLIPDFERETLYKKIAATVDAMFTNGLYNELKQLIEAYKGVPKQCGKTIGYTEFIEYTKSHNKNIFRLNPSDIEKIKYQVKKNQKRYAMHQMGWLDKMQGYQTVKDIDQAKLLIDKFIKPTDNESKVSE